MLDSGREQADPLALRPQGAAPMSRAHVLVVEDDAVNARLMNRLLTAEGYTVQVAGDGESALEAIAANRPDVVLLDVQLPGIDGFVVCQSIKQNPTTRLLPVILVTGMGAREHRLAGIRAGADEFLTKPFDIEELQARVASLVRLKRYTDELDSAESVILSLALTVEARDAYTVGHCQRLARYATALGEAMGLAPDDLAALHRGAYLHDVGKIAVPDAILQKPARLTADEYEVIKQHTIVGERLCGSLRSLLLVRPIVRHHHERCDGTGYPDGLHEREIPILAEIVAVVDTFDAVTTTRPYRPARSVEIAFEELRRDVALGKRRADVVEQFIDLVSSGRIIQAR
jgi:cyclic di-GMP phosphodiesterase